MTKEYFSDFVFKQKCVPWFIITRWRVLIAKWRALVVKFREFVQVQCFIETIDLEKTYGSCFEGKDTFQDAISGRLNKIPTDLLKDTDHVEFLKEFKDKNQIMDNEIKKSGYYTGSLLCIQNYGVFQEKRNEAELLQYCRDFLNLYQILKKRLRLGNYLIRIHVVIDHYRYGYPSVFKISDCDCYMIWDGHHRLACQYLLGERFVKAKIIGVINNHPDYNKS